MSSIFQHSRVTNTRVIPYRSFLILCFFSVPAFACVYVCIQLYCSCCHYGVIKHDDNDDKSQFTLGFKPRLFKLHIISGPDRSIGPVYRCMCVSVFVWTKRPLTDISGIPKNVVGATSIGGGLNKETIKILTAPIPASDMQSFWSEINPESGTIGGCNFSLVWSVFLATMIHARTAEAYIKQIDHQLFFSQIL